MTNDRLEFYCGEWACASDDSTLRLVVKLVAGKPVIEAYDSRDSEEFEVSSVRWRVRSVSFVLHVPSTGFTTRNTLTFSGGGAKLTFTVQEVWHRVRQDGKTRRGRTLPKRPRSQ
jgi:hypothetical protein